ncbi:lipase family protein [Candidatus Dependentiae bacterium]|nr:lipase family protein [Candidatus Dependentiae bacterium]
MLHLTKWVGEQPYFIARDSARRAIVVSIRGTMSIQDCITDCMYKPVLLNADTIGMPQYTGCQLHCHAGVVTATNFILSDLEKHGILHRILLGDACSHGSKGKQKDWDTDVIFHPEILGGHERWPLVLCGHSLGAGVATVLSLHLRQVFSSVRVWAIEPPGGLMSAELAAACREWTISTIHGSDLITRLSGPCLLKLRRDLVDSLVRCKVNKFTLLSRLSCSPDLVEIDDFLLKPGDGEHEAEALRQEFERFHMQQIKERPLMVAPLYPPGRLLHLRRISNDNWSRPALGYEYEARWVSANDLMAQGLVVSRNFFTDHFPDKVVAVLSELSTTIHHNAPSLLP